MFAKFFKPRWQHSKPAVRVRAVHRLSPDNSEHQAVLARLARQDQSPEVRLAAVTRILTPALLSDIVAHESDPDVKRLAADRICKIILDPGYPLSQQKECLAYLQDNNMLAHIALNSESSEIQELTVQQISDQHCLTTLALCGNNTQLRQRAAQKIEQSDLLEQVAREIKGKDKTVFRIIRNKQQQLQQRYKIQAATEQRLEELLDSLEHLSNTEYFSLFGAKFDALCKEWQQQTEQIEAQKNLTERFQSLCKQCEEVLQQEQQRCKSRENLAREKKLAKQQRQAIKQELQDCLTRCQKLLSCSGLCKADLDAEQQCRESIRERWLQLEHTEQDAHREVEAVYNDISQLINIGNSWLEKNTSVQELLNSSEESLTEEQIGKTVKTIDAVLKQISWPAEISAPSALQELLNFAAQLKQQQADLARKKQHNNDDLQSLLQELETRIESGHTRQAVQLEQKVTIQINRLNGSVPKSLQQQHRTICARLAELKDWQGYAIVPKKEQLVEQMTALIGVGTDPAQLAKQIHELQQQWKELDAEDPVHSHNLWQQFKNASDQAYKPCEEYFKDQKQQREQNLEKRKQLVQELEQQLQLIDWDNADWKALEQQNRDLKNSWKNYAPVDRTPGREVQSRFNQLLKQLDARLKQHREEVATCKQQLLQKALQLTEAENAETAATEIRQLQKEWKEAGNTFHQTERTLWPEFRSACNRVFELLNQQKQMKLKQREHEQQTEELLQSSEYQALLHRINLCDQLETLMIDGTLDQLALDELQSAWQQGDQAGKDFSTLIEKRFDQLLELVAGRIEMEELTEITAQSLRQLCIRLEILLGLDSPEQDQALRMEYQMDRLQKALEQRHQQSTATDLKKLELEWQCHPFTQQHEALQIRFYSNLEQAKR